MLLLITLCVINTALGQEDESAASRRLNHLTEEARITSSLRIDYFESSNNLDAESNFLGATAQFKALPTFSDSVSAKLEARITAPDVRGRAEYGPRGTVLESYLAFHGSQIDLKVGKQILAWGRADGINPTDNLTPRNFRILLPFDEDQRAGIWAARVDAYLPHSYALQLFVSPGFEPDQFPLPTGPLPSANQLPARTIKNTEVALKISRVIDESDWSASYFHGYSLLPSIVAANPVVQLNYAKIDVLGGDYARNFGHYGFRSEIALTLPSIDGTSDRDASRSRLFWVNGVDRTFGDNFNVNAQLFLRWMSSYTDSTDVPDQASRSLTALNHLVLSQESGLSSGLTFRISDKWINDTFSAELFMIENFARGDFYLRPLVGYDIDDHLKLQCGANYYAGPRDTPFGLLRPNRGLFIELKFAH